MTTYQTLSENWLQLSSRGYSSSMSSAEEMFHGRSPFGSRFTKRLIPKRFPSKKVLRTGKLPNGSGFLQIPFHFIQT